MACGRTTPLSLTDLAGLTVLQRLSQKAVRQEHEYMEKWRNKLSQNLANIEENMSLNNVDPTEVIQQVSGKLKEQEEKMRVAREQQRKKRMEEEMMENKRVTRGTKRRAQEQPGIPNNGKKYTSNWAPAQTFNDSSLRSNLMPFLRYKITGIPVGVDVEEYIRYRKCLYLENVRNMREKIQSALTPTAIQSLLNLIYRMEGGHPTDYSQLGVFTLKVMLLNQFSQNFRMSFNDLHKIFSPKFLVMENYHRPNNIENRIGPTVLRNSLLEAASLSHLSLEQTCTDNILECVGKVARNITYLNISGSCVSDQGLLNLVGVENDGSLSRKHLSRSCKQNISNAETLVKDKNPRWIKLKDRGAENLTFLEAFSLTDLNWPSRFSIKNSPIVPIDAGFVAILDFVPGLKVLNTEVGCRAVTAFSKYQKFKRKSKQRYLNLEVLSETKPSSQQLDIISNLCPNLTKLNIERQELTILRHDSPLDTEDWLQSVFKFKNVDHLRVKSIDLRTLHLKQSLPSFGHQLNILQLEDIWIFKYSLLKQLCQDCPNLTKLSMIMLNRHINKKIIVEKDADLRNLSCKQHSFRKLRELHLVGPLFAEYVRYAISGVNDLRCLTLGIEWPHETFCTVGPELSIDYIGKEYMQELLSVNTLEGLEEIHFFAQYKRGAIRLTEAFAVYLASTFKNLKHLGTFKLWSGEMNPATCMQIIKMINPSITFDENYSVKTNKSISKENKTDRITFNAKSFKDMSPYSCSWLNIKPQPSFTFLTGFAELLVGPPFHWGPPDLDVPDLDEDGDSDSSSDMGDLLHPMDDPDDEDDDDDDDGVDQIFLNECPYQ